MNSSFSGPGLITVFGRLVGCHRNGHLDLGELDHVAVFVDRYRELGEPVGGLASQDITGQCLSLASPLQGLAVLRRGGLGRGGQGFDLDGQCLQVILGQRGEG